MGKQKKKSQSSVLLKALNSRIKKYNIKPTVDTKKLHSVIKKINPDADTPLEDLSAEVRASLRFMRSENRRFHGAKVSTLWFPWGHRHSKCKNRFGYLTKGNVRSSSRLNFNNTNIDLLNQLGNLMGNSGRENGIPDSNIPAGYTYFGQFVDHNITLDVSSSLDTKTDARKIDNMRSPVLDLDSVYGKGPALNPYLYEFPTSGFTTAIKFKLGENRNTGIGGPGGSSGSSGMQAQTDFDLPRIKGTNTAVIGDPRNDENLIVSQFHSAMLKFHNQVVDLLVLANFTGDIFVEAKKMVTHHYQWAVVNDFLDRICDPLVVNDSLANVSISINGRFSMPVEFSVAAYRFGHSLIRENYWLNFNFVNQPLSDVFSFVRNPNLPVLSNWVIDFNAFFNTNITVPIFNMARKIDSVLSAGLETIPGGSGIMSILAARNLRRGLSFGLPSGQATANSFGITPLTNVQLTNGLPVDEVALLNSNGGLLLNKTPLWYYILRESAVLSNGDHLGPVGSKIVSDTFIKMLKRDPNSYLNESGFAPTLPSKVTGDFTVADLIIFSGVNQP